MAATAIWLPAVKSALPTLVSRDASTASAVPEPTASQVEKRCTIAHELAHAERGPLPHNPVLAAREESAVEQEASRLLIDLDALADALKWAHNLPEAADVLWVDVPTLQVRLDHLHPTEQAWLTNQLADD